MNKLWNDIYGQEAPKNILNKLILSKKIPHALLFQGPPGVGKDFTAVKFAQVLNEEFISDENIKNKINHQIKNLTEPYIKYIFALPRGKNETENDTPLDKISGDDLKDIRNELSKKIKNPYYKIKIPKASNIRINSIREINKFIAYNYSDIKFRIILISDAHLMNESSQNALLKNLEEPPEGVVFILTTPFPGRLRETIRSRCWNLNFSPLNNIDLTEILINQFEIKKENAQSVAPFAGGSVTTALDLLAHDFDLLKEKTIFILRYSFGKKYHSALNEFSPLISDDGPSSIKLIIQMIITWLNDLQKLKFNEDDFFFEDHKETLVKFNQKFPEIKLNNVVTRLDRLSTIIQNNINLNSIALNIVFLLSSMVMDSKKKAA